MKALIAMSGGVDSSVAAALMIKKGYECIGVTMKLHDEKTLTDGNIPAAGLTAPMEMSCCTEDDIADARKVAERLGIEHFVFDFKDDFRCKVMDYFADSYMRGETPNPCIQCNRHLKFEALYRKAKELGCDVIVTGHYARVGFNEETGRYELKCGVDASKDQSYVLYSLTQEQLSHTCFPLGEYTKEECRRIAEELGFVNAAKKDSQDICFIPDGNYKRFLELYVGHTMPPGNFVDTEGRVIGRHTGICNYTIGQRKGLGIALGKPAFVKEIRPETNEVVISDNDSLFVSTLIAKDFNWVAVSAENVPVFVGNATECAPGEGHFETASERAIITREEQNCTNSANGTGLRCEDGLQYEGGLCCEDGSRYEDGLRCAGKVRYKHNAAPARVMRLSVSGSDSGLVRVIFDQPQRAITKGQAVVLYDGDVVIGGGTIVE